MTAAELQEFVKQSECLNLPPPAVLDSEKGIKVSTFNLAASLQCCGSVFYFYFFSKQSESQKLATITKTKTPTVT